MNRRKLCCLSALFLLCVAMVSAAGVGFEFGIGSGYVFYGNDGVRDRNKLLSDANQVLLCMNTGALYRIAPHVYFCAGVDSMLDLRWSGGDHINLVDYAGLIGFHIYPGRSGLVGTVEYALGRRSDFISVDGGTKLDDVYHTGWGNGFKFGLAYDFARTGLGFAPVIGASWRHMPRGDDSNDDIIAVFFKIAGK